jgi:hypothetical protein
LDDPTPVALIPMTAAYAPVLTVSTRVQKAIVKPDAELKAVVE